MIQILFQTEKCPQDCLTLDVELQGGEDEDNWVRHYWEKMIRVLKTDLLVRDFTPSD